MKKLLSLLLTIFIVFSLVGCNSKPDEDEPIIEEQSQTQEVIQEETKKEEKIEEEEVVVEESKEEEKIVSQDITNMSFWVVFYDQYGNELQREALKYGTVPEYKSWLPEGFDKWVYKKSGKDVGSFKSITGNTYYQAVCHEVHHSSSTPEPDPTPDPVPDPTPDPVPDPTPTPSEPNYLYFKNIGNTDASFYFWPDSGGGSYVDSLSFQYSKDKISWYDADLTSTSDEDPIVLAPGEIAYLKAKTTNDYVYYYLNGTNYGGAYICSDDDDSASLEVGGSVMTLLDPTDTRRDLTGTIGCFYYLFYAMYNLKNADNLVLPATTLANSCYGEMFYDCEYLTTVNENLLSAATDLTNGDYCCYSMFEYCYSLTNAPELPATILANNCYEYMFYDCYALNDHVKLPSTNLENSCYKYMFYGCSSFNDLEVSFSTFDSLANDETTDWLYGVESVGTFKWNGNNSPTAGDPDYFGDSKIPTGWTVQGEACLAAGTLITMGDGSQRSIESLRHGDDIKVFDHNTGKMTHAKIVDYWHYDEPKGELITLHFTNNIDISIVNEHSFYNKEENTYVILNKDTIDKYIGKHFYNADKSSWETLIGASYSDEKVETYYLATENHFNCVAEGMLNVEDGVYQVICNTFEYDNKMRINKIKRFIDIIRYGLFDYKEFDYLTKEEFDSHNLSYLKVALGKGIISEDDLILLKEIWTGEKEILDEQSTSSS